MIPVFDGHNDTVLLQFRQPQRDYFARNDGGHIDHVRAREGGFAGGFYAIFVPSADDDDPFENMRPRAGGGFDAPPVGPLEPLYAARTAQAMSAVLLGLEQASGGSFRIVRTADELGTCLANGTTAAIWHFEGAEAIGPDLAALDVYYRAGLRSLGIVWSRPNIFGHGVPFSYPSSPDTGPGLTLLGRRLVRRCNALGIMVDLSHITERGFWDVAEESSAPLVATHSNAHAICPVPRNLTDEQLRAVGDSHGMVGLNFAVTFLSPESGNDADLPLDTMVRHIDHLVEHAGIDSVGLGSDFDGALVPSAIGDVAGVQRLLEALAGHGYDEASVRKIAHENWLRVLRATWAS